jgi:hypothetical protein
MYASRSKGWASSTGRIRLLWTAEGCDTETSLSRKSISITKTLALGGRLSRGTSGEGGERGCLCKPCYPCHHCFIPPITQLRIPLPGLLSCQSRFQRNMNFSKAPANISHNANICQCNGYVLTITNLRHSGEFKFSMPALRCAA